MCKLSEKVQENANVLGQLIADTINENKHLKQTSFYRTTLVESSDDCVYVTDIETNEILFINEETKKLFGDVVGKTCFEAFHDLDAPCFFCTNEIILKDIGKPYKWVFYHEKNKKLYYIIDVAKEVNGRMLRFERAINLNGEATEIVAMFQKHNLV